MYLIIAPHKDDELIGCWNFINLVNSEFDIMYLFKDKKEYEIKKYIDLIREIISLEFDEPKNDSEWREIKKYLSMIDFSEYEYVIVPSTKDNHYNHKMLNSVIKSILPLTQIYYYQVEMNLAMPIGEKRSKEKYDFLKKVYGKKFLDLKSNKYHLFENVEKTDVKKFIEMSYDMKGIHCWPDSKGKYKDSLSKPHFHLFKFRIKIQVFENNRELEFLEVLDDLKMYTYTLSPFYSNVSILNFESTVCSSMSCEDIATMILNYIFKNYPNRAAEVCVCEDNGCGACVSWEGVK